MNAEAFTYIRAALEGPVPDLIVATWQELASDHRASGEYSASLSFAKLFPYQGKPLSVAVANTSPHAQVLESGHEGFHLPARIDWGAAMARMQAKHPTWHITKPFLFVPFRHMTPGTESGGISSLRERTMMPAAVYADAKRMIAGDQRAAERVAQAGRWLSRPYGTMALDKAHGRRGVAELSALTVRTRAQLGQPGYTWQSKLYEGLTHRMQKNPAGKVTGGGWYTFRTITPNSLGFFIPPMEGFHYAERTAAIVANDVRDLLGEAAKLDVSQLISLRVGDRRVV